MATEFNFDGEIIVIPGTRSRLVSGVKNQPAELSYGIALFIDTGSGAGFGGGAGINGEGAQGKEAFYEFTNDKDLRNFVAGGLIYKLALPLFQPAGVGIQGVSKLIYVRAATTTRAQVDITFNGDGNASTSVFLNGGTLTVKSKYEGEAGNGVVNPALSGVSKGFFVGMSSGVDDTSKFILKFYRGGYTGLDENGFPLDGIAENDAVPITLVTSPEFDNIQEVIDWMNSDAEFNGYFKLTASSVNGTGEIDEFDLLDFGGGSGFMLFSGGTESFNSSDLDDVFEYAADYLFTFILADKYGADSQHGNNYRIAQFANQTHPFKPEVYIASQSDKTGFTDSKADTVFYDNQNVTIVHGGSRTSNRNSALGYREHSAIYTAAAWLGREAGRPPQVPLTFKHIAVSGLTHSPSTKEVKQGLKAGLLMTNLDGGRYQCVKGVNSLQKNTNLLNEDGTSHSKQLRRIGRQLNMEIIVNSKKQLLEREDGVNRNTLSEADVKAWLHGYLKLKTAKSDVDNLIVSQRNIVVTRNQDKYDITYEVVLNTEISFLLFTGKIVDL